MSLQFTSSELSRIDTTLQALLSPLGCRDVDVWRDLVLQQWAELPS